MAKTGQENTQMKLKADGIFIGTDEADSQIIAAANHSPHPLKERKDHARRLAASWNTCRGIPTEELEQLTGKNIRPDWDKTTCANLKRHGLTHADAMAVVGELAEQIQQAYMQGYSRGYNHGAEQAKPQIPKCINADRMILGLVEGVVNALTACHWFKDFAWTANYMSHVVELFIYPAEAYYKPYEQFAVAAGDDGLELHESSCLYKSVISVAIHRHGIVISKGKLLASNEFIGTTEYSDYQDPQFFHQVASGVCKMLPLLDEK